MSISVSTLRLSPVLCLLAFSSFGQTVIDFDPPFGSTGERIVITGQGFIGGALTVRFGGPSGPRDTTAVATSDSIIHAKVPSGAVTGPIYVQVGSKSVLSLNDFLVLGLGPFLTGFFPAYGSVNEQVVITGWHLTNLSQVKFGGGKISNDRIVNANGTQITARVPAGATNGPITVTTTFGASNTVDSFTVIGAGPFIADFFPQLGSAGSTVAIDGAHFTGVTNVFFGTKAGRNLFVQSDIRILVDAPPGVETSRLSVRAPLGRYTNSAYFYVPPVITGFSPGLGRGGTNVTITGSNFLGTLSVRIGGQEAIILAATNNSSLLVAAPSGAPSGVVRVNAPAGAALSTSNFNYQPLITGFSPQAGTVGTNVIITGANLNEGYSGVKLNGVTAPTNAPPQPQSVSVKVPAGAFSGPISITTSNGTFTTTNLFYLPPGITKFVPTNSAPASTVTITGTNLLGVTNVTFNGIPATFTPPTTHTQLLAQVPAGVSTGPITVSTPGGTATAGRFYGAPVVTGFTPTHGIPGTQVTISGTNFLDATAVKFNGLAASGFNVLSNGTAITVSVPTGAATGPISITAPAGTAVSTELFSIDLLSDLSVQMVAAPDPVFVGSNLVYTLTVTNSGPFDAPNVVLQDQLPTSLKLLSNTVSRGSASVQSNRVTASFGTLARSNTASLLLFVAPQNVVGPVQNTAETSSGYEDPVPANNTATVAVTVLPLPLLSIRPYSSSQRMITWPSMLEDYILQYRAAFGAQGWTNLGTPPTVSGTNRFVIETTGSGTRFYRLKK